MLKGGPHIIDEAIYRSDPGVNISALKNLKTTPAKARRRLDNPPKQSAALELGTAIHAAILERDKFLETYGIKPNVDLRTKAGKEALAEASQSGKILLSAEDYDTALTLGARVHECSFLQRFVKNGIYESSWFHEHELGLRIKGRLDIWLPEMDIIVDIKTTDSADEYSFRRDCVKYHYYNQAAWYSDLVTSITGRSVAGYVILAVEKSEDKDIRAFWLDDAFLDKGRKENREWLSQWYLCEKTGQWPGYEKKIQTLKAPKWFEESEDAN